MKLKGTENKRVKQKEKEKETPTFLAAVILFIPRLSTNRSPLERRDSGVKPVEMCAPQTRVNS